MSAPSLPRRLIAALNNHRALADTAVAGLLLSVLLAAASYFEAFEGLASLVANNRWHLDDIILALLLSGVLGFVYGTRRIVDLRREIARRRTAEAEVRRLAFDDPLTGLPNRRSYKLRLERLIEHASQGSAGFAVMLIDLDHFKFINDVHGHAAGDQVLMTVAERVSPILTPDDFMARLGGDEFVVVARSIQTTEAAARLALQIIRAISEPVPFAQMQIEIGATIGVAMYPANGTDMPTLTRRADMALYRAKQDGRNQAHFFEPAMDLLLAERSAVESALRAAIREERVGVHYQPIIDLETGKVVGFEALARWTDTVLGSVPPTTFIQIAEDAGLIVPLANFLLARACGDAATWPSEVTLSFNISAMQLRDRLLALRILGILAKTGLAPARLELEITESAIVKDPEAAHRTLQQLREAGIKIAIDDFGTGYSNLAQLSRFPFDKIKIDRSFVDNLGEDAEQTTLVRAIIGLGKGLGLMTIAEGVESAQQAAFLRGEGCEMAQGFLFGKAVAAEEALAIARTGVDTQKPWPAAQRAKAKG